MSFVWWLLVGFVIKVNEFEGLVDVLFIYECKFFLNVCNWNSEILKIFIYM